MGVPLFSRRQAWDLAVDICLSQLPTIIEEGTAFRVSPTKGILWSTGGWGGSVPGHLVRRTPRCCVVRFPSPAWEKVQLAEI